MSVDVSISGLRVARALDRLIAMRVRDECPNEHWFGTLREAGSIIETWHKAYNSTRPHSALEPVMCKNPTLHWYLPTPLDIS